LWLCCCCKHSSENSLQFVAETVVLLSWCRTRVRVLWRLQCSQSHNYSDASNAG
jgi:hypothetical protein